MSNLAIGHVYNTEVVLLMSIRRVHGTILRPPVQFDMQERLPLYMLGLQKPVKNVRYIRGRPVLPM